MGARPTDFQGPRIRERFTASVEGNRDSGANQVETDDPDYFISLVIEIRYAASLGETVERKRRCHETSEGITCGCARDRFLSREKRHTGMISGATRGGPFELA